MQVVDWAATYMVKAAYAAAPLLRFSDEVQIEAYTVSLISVA